MNTYTVIIISATAFTAGFVTSWSLSRFTIMILKTELKKIKEILNKIVLF